MGTDQEFLGRKMNEDNRGTRRLFTTSFTDGNYENVSILPLLNGNSFFGVNSSMNPEVVTQDYNSETQTLVLQIEFDF